MAVSGILFQLVVIGKVDRGTKCHAGNETQIR
jgi:hypothetical protein